MLTGAATVLGVATILGVVDMVLGGLLVAICSIGLAGFYLDRKFREYKRSRAFSKCLDRAFDEWKAKEKAKEQL